MVKRKLARRARPTVRLTRRRPRAPKSMNEFILAAARTGIALPAGTFPFTPPLDLIDIESLTGAGPGKTILQALPGSPPSTHLVNLKTHLPGDVTIGLPNGPLLSNFRIVGNGPAALEYGLFVDAGCADIERVCITNTYTGVVGAWMVDVTFRRCKFSRNECAIYIPGSGLHTVTTTSFLGCQIRESLGTAVLIQQAWGVSFDDWTIIESNKGNGLVTESVNGSTVEDVRLHDVWFENNYGEPIVDNAAAITTNTAVIQRRPES